MSDYFTIKQIRRVVFGNHVSPHSLRRWIARGLGHPHVKLPALRIGRTYFVREADAREFLEAINDPQLFARRKATERCEQAKRRLRRAGA